MTVFRCFFSHDAVIVIPLQMSHTLIFSLLQNMSLVSLLSILCFFLSLHLISCSHVIFHLPKSRREALLAAKTASTYPTQFKLAFMNDYTMMHLSYHVTEPFSRRAEHHCQYAKYSESEPLSWRSMLVVRFETYHPSAGTEVTHRMVQLEPNTRYVYKCMDSEIYSFKTTDFRFERRDEPSRFLLLGDYGSEFANATVRSISRRVQNTTYDAVMLVGDISYADIFDCVDYELVWDEFFKEMQPVIATHPFMVLPGNHEYKCRGQGDCVKWATNFVPYNAKFTMPFSTGKTHNMWYSFVWRNVKVVMISTETDYPGAPFSPKFGDQIKWIEAELRAAQANRDKVPFVVVMGHRPIYSSHLEYSKDGVPTGSALILQRAIEDLMYRYQVDLYVCGHVHSYERTYPTYQNKRNDAGTVHMVIGHAGNPEGPTKEESYANPSPAWSAFHFTEDIGYVDLQTTQDYMLWTMYSSTSDKVADQVRINRRK